MLDTNIWIDILVFNDPITRPILTALEAGRLEARIDAHCIDELACVLDYPQFVRHAIDKAAALDHVTRLTHRITACPIRALPLCRDRDDQKFLELAYAAEADWLVSKDRALLKMAPCIARGFGFRIAEPALFVAACVHATASGRVRSAAKANASRDSSVG